jgi:hypothetical protein
MGNVYFHQYKLENVIDITLSGQHLIRYLANNFNDYFKNRFWKDKRFFDTEDPSNAVTRPVVKIIETDSVTGDTIINVDNKDITIAELYESATNEKSRGTNHYRSFNNDKYTKTVNTNFEIEDKQINYVMKHSVEKEMYEITVDGKSVIITSDHSLMVEREGLLISVKPSEIQEHDNLITIKE